MENQKPVFDVETVKKATDDIFQDIKTCDDLIIEKIESKKLTEQEMLWWQNVGQQCRSCTSSDEKYESLTVDEKSPFYPYCVKINKCFGVCHIITKKYFDDLKQYWENEEKKGNYMVNNGPYGPYVLHSIEGRSFSFILKIVEDSLWSLRKYRIESMYKTKRSQDIYSYGYKDVKLESLGKMLYELTELSDEEFEKIRPQITRDVLDKAGFDCWSCRNLIAYFGGANSLGWE